MALWLESGRPPEHHRDIIISREAYKPKFHGRERFYLFLFCIIFTFLTPCMRAQSTTTETPIQRELDDTFKSGNGDSLLYTCPEETWLYKNQCYWLVQYQLTWSQANSTCQSKGGHLARISSETEHDWIADLLQAEVLQNGTVWIGFARQPDSTFVWSNGQPAQQQDGFWATDGLRILDIPTAFQTPQGQATKLCCYLDSPTVTDNSPYSSHGARLYPVASPTGARLYPVASPTGARLYPVASPTGPRLYPVASPTGLRWYLGTCDTQRASLCQQPACEVHAHRCTDGSRCVPQPQVCDGMSDCQDGSDEENCGSTDQATSSRDSGHQCGFHFKAANGTFKFPKSTQEYPPFSRCLWTVETEPINFIKITITDLDIETGYDFLSVYNGRHSAGDLVQTFTGRQDTPQSVTVPTWLATVVFKADATIGASGVTLHWETVPVDGSACGGQLVAQGWEEYLNPTVPQLRGQTNCEWLISTTKPDQLISFQFESLDLRPGNTLTVYDGPGRGSPVITSISGDTGALSPGLENSTQIPGALVKIPPVILSSGSQLFVTLSTDGGTLGEFVAKYREGCQIYVHSDNSTVLLLSPGYGVSRYPANMNCSWTVFGSGTEEKVLFLPGFSTEWRRDVITVYSGLVRNNDSILGILSGETPLVQSGYFSPVGDFHITFKTDATVNQGRWALLISQGCEKLVSSQSLLVDFQNSSFGGTVRFSCDEGFYVEGPETKTCWVGRQWMPAEVPICKVISCGAVPVTEGSYLERVSGSKFGDTAIYSCDLGYRLVGSNTTRCNAQGWQDVPECQVITCPKQKPPHQGSAWATSTVFGTLRKYYCKAPTRLIGSAFSHCTESGQWTDDVPICEYPHCPVLPNPPHGNLSTSDRVRAGESMTVSCETGYKLQGPKELTCRLNGTYDKTLSSCEDIDECSIANPCEPNRCTNLPESYACVCPDGYFHKTGSLQICEDINECDIGSPCSHICENLNGTFSCDCPSGFLLYGGPTYTTRDGVDLREGRTCIQTCPPLTVNNATRIVYDQEPLYDGTFLMGTSTKTVCPDRYHIENSSPALCLSNDQWSHIDVNCIVSECTPPDVSVPNLQVSYTSLVLYSEALMSCDPGFVLVGNSKLYCLPDVGSIQASDFVWSGTLPTCKGVSCLPPTAPALGHVSVEGTGYQDSAVFTCYCGHRLVGDSVVTCTVDGTWSAPPPTCEPMSCDAPVIPQCGNLASATPGFPIGSQAEFQCNSRGFVLSDTNPVTCQALEHSKVSELLPTVNVYLTLDLNFKSLGIRRNCLGKYQKKIRKSLELWLSQTAVCSGGNWKTVVQMKPGLLDKQPSLEFIMSIRAQSEELLCACSEAVDQRLKRLDITMLLQQQRSGSRPCGNLVDVVSSKPLKETGWACPLGLRLETSGFPCQSGKKPVCMEDCIMPEASYSTEITTPMRSVYNTTSRPDSAAVTEKTNYPIGTTDGSVVHRLELNVTKRISDLQDLSLNKSSSLNGTLQDVQNSTSSNTTHKIHNNVTEQSVFKNMTTANPFFGQMPSLYNLSLHNSSSLNKTFENLYNSTFLNNSSSYQSYVTDEHVFQNSTIGNQFIPQVNVTQQKPETYNVTIHNSSSLNETFQHVQNSTFLTATTRYDHQGTIPPIGHQQQSTREPWEVLQNSTNANKTTEVNWYDVEYSEKTTRNPWGVSRDTGYPTFSGAPHVNFEKTTRNPWGGSRDTGYPTFSDAPHVNFEKTTRNPWGGSRDTGYPTFSGAPHVNFEKTTRNPWGGSRDTGYPTFSGAPHVNFEKTTRNPWGGSRDTDYPTFSGAPHVPWGGSRDTDYPTFSGAPHVNFEKTTRNPWGGSRDTDYPTFSGAPHVNFEKTTRNPWGGSRDTGYPTFSGAPHVNFEKTTRNPWGGSRDTGYPTFSGAPHVPWGGSRDTDYPTFSGAPHVNFEKTTRNPWGGSRDTDYPTFSSAPHVNFEKVGNDGTSLGQESENTFLKRKTSDSLWRESSDGRSQRVSDFPSSDPHFSQLGVSSDKFQAFNCSELLQGDVSWRGSAGEVNSTDCLASHPLEKDEMTLVQSPSVPRSDMKSPIYTVEAHDTMSGGFLNITCIDAVHISINSKVNELLREFGTQMGRAVCGAASDSTLQLATGNIRFKGTMAHIYTQFSISYDGSNRRTIETCGEEFKTYAASQLPKKFRRMKREIPQRECSFVQYSGQEFRFSNSGWSCRSGYTLELFPFQCKASHVKDSIASLAASTHSSIASSSRPPVTSVPRLTLNISGVFSPAFYGELVNDSCIVESSTALSLLLSRLEGNLQGRYLQCKDIYINISSGVDLTRRSRNKLNAQADCSLIALDNSVTKDALSKCAGFLSLEYREPLVHLSTVTMTQPYLPASCPPIALYPPELRVDLNAQQFSCQPGYHYLSKSFKCIEGSILSRHRRDVKADPSVEWDAKIPQCVDVEAPVMLGCPTDAVFVTIGSSAESQGFREPIAIDNNPQRPTVSFTPNMFNFFSYIFRVPGIFPVTMAAKDANGNKAECSFSFYVQSSPFPNMQCPTKIVTIYSDNGIIHFPDNFLFPNHQVVHNTTQNLHSNSSGSFNLTEGIRLGSNESRPVSHSIHFTVVGDNNRTLLRLGYPVDVETNANGTRSTSRSDNGTRSTFQSDNDTRSTFRSDNGTRSASLLYFLDSNIPLQYDKVMQFAARTTDSNGVVLQSCDFFLTMKRPSYICDKTHLAQHGAHVTCIDVENALSCSVSCPFGWSFVTPPPQQYLCLTSVQWVPEDPVPKCGKSYPTDYVIMLVVGLRYHGDNITHACLESIEEAVARDLQSRVERSCHSALDRGNIQLSPIGDGDIFTSNTPFAVMSTKIKIKIKTIHQDGGNQTESAEWCTRQLRRDLKFHNATLAVSCGECSLDVSVDKQLNQTCPRGMALVGDNTFSGTGQTRLSCVECPPGMFEEKGNCMDCPIGQYQPDQRSTYCLSCPPGLYTPTPGAISSDQCSAQCEVNHYSPTGLQPCIPCPPWTKQEVPGSTSCEDLTFEDYAGTTCNTTADYCLFSPCIHGQCRNLYGDYICDCDTGYTGRRCETRMWSSCYHNPCKNNAICHSDNTSTGYQCVCPQGYSGPNCTVSDIDCSILDCYNGGYFENTTCKCVCQAGFQGDSCQIEMDVCSGVNCKNGGACEKSLDSFVCVCQVGYTGIYCDQKLERCDNTFYYCFNGGACVENQTTFTGYSCDCPKGYQGEVCLEEEDYCASQPCHPEGTLECENSGLGGYRCICLPGRTGALCEVNLDPCFSQPCSNGQVCLETNHTDGQTYKCSCPVGFEGPDCSTPTDKCSLNPCSNKAKCVADGAQISCQCMPGFSGNKCEINIDECAPSPCRNGGTCYDGVNFFTCGCLKGYRGRHCELFNMACLRQPCRNEASCTDIPGGDFLCTCQPGYTGQFCETTIDVCEVNPCQNEGRCVASPPHNPTTSPSTPAATTAGDLPLFHCECPPQFTGVFCTEPLAGTEDCRSDSTLSCLNGGVCRILWPQEKEICECLPQFYGPNCAKLKSSNFDLVFSGDDSDQWYIWDLDMSATTHTQAEITLCVWVKFLDSESDSSYLTVTMGDGSSIVLTGESVISPSPAMTKPLSTGDGLWHHVCLIISHLSVSVFTDGILSTHLAVSSRLKPGQIMSLGLGLKDNDQDDSKRFRGYVHGLNVYSSPVSASDIQQMSRACQSTGGDIFSWATLDSTVALAGKLRLREPSTCTANQCLDSSSPDECVTGKDITAGTDRAAPIVVKCPPTKLVTNVHSPTVVNWEEPEFSDNMGVTQIKQSLRPGVALPYGEYFITYIAFDAANNSAICNFHLYVRKFECTDPAPPSNGARVCGEWSHGRYCIPSCKSNYQMVNPPPPFYRCGLEGTWDPGKVDHLVFPVCARVRPPAYSIYGGVQFSSPGDCDDSVKTMLRAKINLVLSQLEDVLDLCEPGEDNCDYRSKLSVECAVATAKPDGSRRKKREVDVGPIYNVYTVQIDLNFMQSVTAMTAGEVRESLEGSIKRVQDEVSLDLSELELSVSPRCMPGQIFVAGETEVCMDCPEGYFSSPVDGQREKCFPCPTGQYNDKTSQTKCHQCPKNLTTLGEGSTSEEDCVESCVQGDFYNTESGQCEACPIGQYQDREGQSTCELCPPGLSTQTPGAKHFSQCQDVCRPGQELWLEGLCRPCPRGTYKSQSHLFCQPCPRMKTTDMSGAESIDLCSIDQCRPGYYWDLERESCYPCLIGSFQSEKGQTACTKCDSGYTTSESGADSIGLCIAAAVDECALQLDSCSAPRVCNDTEDGYECVCMFGENEDEQCIDTCEQFCNRQSFCSEEADTDDGQGREYATWTAVQCDCPIKSCSKKTGKGHWVEYRLLVVLCILISSLTLAVIFVTFTVITYRRLNAHNEKPEIRYYRRNTQREKRYTSAIDELVQQRRDYPENTSSENIYSSIRSAAAFSINSSMRSRAALVVDSSYPSHQRQQQQHHHHRRRRQQQQRHHRKQQQEEYHNEETSWQEDRDVHTVSMPLATVWHSGDMESTSTFTSTHGEAHRQTTKL